METTKKTAHTWDGEQHFPASSKRSDAQFLQVLIGQREKRLEINLNKHTEINHCRLVRSLCEIKHDIIKTLWVPGWSAIQNWVNFLLNMDAELFCYVNVVNVRKLN